MRVMDDLAGLAPVALLMLDNRRHVVEANPEAEAILGQSRRHLAQRPLSDIVFFDSPLFELIDRTLETNRTVNAHGVSLGGPNFSRSVLTDIRLRPDGEGGIVMAMLPASDQNMFATAASVSAFGRILGHEVKNPLAGIVGAAQLLLRHARSDQKAMLDIVQSESKRIERLVSRLSAFELFSAPRFEVLNIHLLLDQIIAAEEAAQGRRISVRRRFDPSLPVIYADHDHLHEAIQNIIRNASEAALATAERPTLTVETAFETGFGFAGLSAGTRLGRSIRVTIEDNGAGITPEKREKMFNLFSSSKAGGRGLGLSVVSEIISAHRGRIKVDSIPGKTRFSVYIPINEKEAS